MIMQLHVSVIENTMQILSGFTDAANVLFIVFSSQRRSLKERLQKRPIIEGCDVLLWLWKPFR